MVVLALSKLQTVKIYMYIFGSRIEIWFVEEYLSG